MNMTDPVADMISRIRNGVRAKLPRVDVPKSKLKVEIARILKDEGYIKDFRVVEATDDKGQPLPYKLLVVELKFARDRRRVITNLKRVSKPGRRVYASVKNLPRVNNGLGISVLSTPKGIMADHDARDANVGGEVLFTVF